MTCNDRRKDTAWHRQPRIRVVGPVPAELLPQLLEVLVTELEPRTVLTGGFADQAELHGFLQRLRAFGLELVEVRSVATTDDEEPPVEDAP